MEKNKKDFITYFKIDNKSGFKTKKEHILKKFPIFYNEIEEFNKKININNFKELLFLFLNDMEEVPKCLNCGKELTFKKSFNDGYGIFCSMKCTNSSEEHKKAVKITNLRLYGGNAPAVNNGVLDKMKKTNKERYGFENLFENVEFIQNKIKDKYGDKNITKTIHFKSIMKNKYEEKYKNITKNNSEIIYQCKKCNNESKHEYNSFNYRTRNNIPLCKICIPPYRSLMEKEFEIFLKEKKLNFIKNNRLIIKPKEIDFIVNNFGIELNGLFYHSEKYVESDYHYNKWFNSLKKEIHLIQVFEDEWKFKRKIVESIILNLITNNKEKIYARKCIIKEIDNNIYADFINNNHIQGYCTCKIKIGLFFNNELVQVMSFSKNRKNLGSKSKDNEYEMIRLCTKTGLNIIGGSEKLLKYFERVYNPKKIITYCDIRFFNGKTYSNLGFSFEKITKPNYFYIKPNELKRYPRYNFRKDNLVKLGFDKNKTEKEIMNELGYLRVFDCGHKKFIKSYY